MQTRLRCVLGGGAVTDKLTQLHLLAKLVKTYGVYTVYIYDRWLIIW